jgi:hypothetical protein
MVIASGSKPALQALLAKLEQQVAAAVADQLQSHQQHKQYSDQRHSKQPMRALPPLHQKQPHQLHTHQQQQWQQIQLDAGQDSCGANDFPGAKRQKLEAAAMGSDAILQQQQQQDQQLQQQWQPREKGMHAEQSVLERLPLFPVLEAIVLGFANAVARTKQPAEEQGQSYQQWQQQQQDRSMQAWHDKFLRAVLKQRVLHAPLVLLLHSAMQAATKAAAAAGLQRRAFDTKTAGHAAWGSGVNCVGFGGAATAGHRTALKSVSPEAAAVAGGPGAGVAGVGGGAGGIAAGGAETALSGSEAAQLTPELQEAAGQFLAALSGLEVHQGLKLVQGQDRESPNHQQQQQCQAVEDGCGVESQQQLQPRSSLSIPGCGCSQWGGWGGLVVGYKGLAGCVGDKQMVLRRGEGGLRRAARILEVKGVEDAGGGGGAVGELGQDAVGMGGEQLSLAAARCWLQQVEQKALAQTAAAGGLGVASVAAGGAAASRFGGGNSSSKGSGTMMPEDAMSASACTYKLPGWQLACMLYTLDREAIAAAAANGDGSSCGDGINAGKQAGEGAAAARMGLVKDVAASATPAAAQEVPKGIQELVSDKVADRQSTRLKEEMGRSKFWGGYVYQMEMYGWWCQGEARESGGRGGYD